jgi:signal transduction histidine kinase
LVADAGGRLVVTSAPGEGTRVEAELPMAHA